LSLHAEGARLERLGADLEAFAAAIRDGLEALDFAGRQRLVRLLVERIIAASPRRVASAKRPKPPFARPMLLTDLLE
jgi:hypothetical protein